MRAARGLLARRQGVTTGDVVAWVAVAAVHAAAVAWMMFARAPAQVPPVTQLMQVSFFSEQVSAQPLPPEPSRAPPPSALQPPPVLAPVPVSEVAITVPAEAVPVPPEAPAAIEPAPVTAVPVSTAPAEAVVQPPDYRAAYLNNPGPRYPEVSRRRREEGTVVLKVLVNSAGAPEQVQIEQSSGFEELDRAAITIVRERWRFEPARQGARAVAAWVAVPLQFKLRNR